jgi:hypothetical protein
MTSLTLITVVVIAYGILSSRGYGQALALGGATGAGAALVVGNFAVPTFYAIAIGTMVSMLLQAVGSARAGARLRQPLPPEVSSLLAFFAWSAMVTVIAPILFDGLPVLAPDGRPRHLNAGFLIPSNYAQTIYLALGISVVIFLARSRSARPSLIGLAAGLTTMLSLWRYLHLNVGLPFPDGFFDNSPAFTYVETTATGIERFRGILSEPAGLAVSCLVTIAYMLPRSLQVRGVRRWGALVVAAVAAYLGAVSTSATFVVAGGITGVIVAATVLCGFLLRRTSINAAVSVVICLATIAAVWLLPLVSGFVEQVISQKLTSSSYADRSSSNIESYRIFLDTLGLGVGLGASRSSAFLPGLLSTTGLVGTALFAVAVTGLIYRSARVREYRPVIWTLVTILVVKLVSGPDLSDSTGILYLSLGLLSHAVHELRTHQPIGPAAHEFDLFPEPVVHRSG